MVEADFQRFYHLDYRDRYRPGGGESKLTIRRLLVLVDGLPPESLFRSAVEGRLPVSEQSAAVGDVLQALTGKPWHRWNALTRQRERAEFKELLDKKRDTARVHNMIYLEARRPK